MANDLTTAQVDYPFLPETSSRKTLWSIEWGLAEYPDDLRRFLERYEADGKIGERVLDLGAGDKPITSDLRTPREIYLVDIAEQISCLGQDGPPKIIPICQDLEGLTQSDPDFFKNLGSMDTLVASSLFNYVSWRRLISDVKDTHNPGGYFFVDNLIGAGLPLLFSRYRPRSHSEIVQTFDEWGYEVIEQVEKSNTSIVIAKKK